MKRLLKEGLNIENHINEIKRKLDFSAFKVRDNLNGDIWNSDDEINKEVKDNLISIAEYYWDSLDLGIPIIDITITGSLANYNWSRFSDIDLHIIFNLDNFGEHNDLIKELLDSKTRTWNTQHDIKIKDFEVEIYLQPEGQPHHSTGVYSLLNDEWIKKPEKMVVNIDKANVRKKYNKLISHIDDIEKDFDVKKDYEDIINRVDSLKEKIKNMRKSGLESGGEFSIENIVFKLLRRNEIMSKLNDLVVNAYDDMMTIDEGELTENHIRGLLRIGLLEDKQIPWVRILRENKSDKTLDMISTYVDMPYIQQMKDKYGVTDKESQKYIFKQIYGDDVNFLDKNNNFLVIHNFRDTVNPNFAGKILYIEDSNGWWEKYIYNDNGKETYREDSNGKIIDNRPQKISSSDSKETPQINTSNINDGNFSNSVVKDVVWRAGKILGQEPGGGIWFGVNKEDVENFTKQVRNEIRVGKPYKINLQNPYYFDSFWHGYLDKINFDKNSRLNYKKKLEKQGYDGMIIGEDWWNDTGDEDAIFSKQYVVFDPKNVKPL